MVVGRRVPSPFALLGVSAWLVVSEVGAFQPSAHIFSNRRSFSNTCHMKLDVPIPSAKEQAFDSSCVKEDGSVRGLCNWLLPQHIMIGRYPHGAPFSGRPTPEESRTHLTKVIKAGVRTFVCLQDEVPPQDDAAAWSKHRHGFSRYFSDATDIAKALGHEVSFLHLPIEDFGTPPDESKLKMTLDDVAARVLGGSAVYIHCWGGRGRAATVGACLMLQVCEWNGASASEAAEVTLMAVQNGFETRPGYDGGRSPETSGQRAFVRDFATQVVPTA